MWLDLNSLPRAKLMVCVFVMGFVLGFVGDWKLGLVPIPMHERTACYRAGFSFLVMCFLDVVLGFLSLLCCVLFQQKEQIK